MGSRREDMLNAANVERMKIIAEQDKRIAELDKAINEVDQACIPWGLYFDTAKPKESLAALLRMTVIGATDPDISREAAVNNLEQQAKGAIDACDFVNMLFERRGLSMATIPAYEVFNMVNSYGGKMKSQSKTLKEKG